MSLFAGAEHFSGARAEGHPGEAEPREKARARPTDDDYDGGPDIDGDRDTDTGNQADQAQVTVVPAKRRPELFPAGPR